MEFVVRSNYYWKGLQEGRYELQGLRTIADLARQGDTVLDVGAWMGPYTLLLSRLVKSSGLVCSFEPEPRTRRILMDNVRKNHLSNVQIEPCCLVSHVGNAILRSNNVDTSTSTVMNHELPGKSQQIVVQASTIDAYCSLKGLRPSGIKIDVEGSEGLVLSGARKTLRECSPWVLLELHNKWLSQEEKRGIWEILIEGAKDITYIEGTHSSHGHGDKITTTPADWVARLLVRY